MTSDKIADMVGEVQRGRANFRGVQDEVKISRVVIKVSTERYIGVAPPHIQCAVIQRRARPSYWFGRCFGSTDESLVCTDPRLGRQAVCVTSQVDKLLAPASRRADKLVNGQRVKEFVRNDQNWCSLPQACSIVTSCMWYLLARGVRHHSSGDIRQARMTFLGWCCGSAGRMDLCQFRHILMPVEDSGRCMCLQKFALSLAVEWRDFNEVHSHQGRTERRERRNSA
eukprot:scaffold273605_cov37-Tisochrysis_lutea.AAC.2